MDSYADKLQDTDTHTDTHTHRSHMLMPGRDNYIQIWAVYVIGKSLEVALPCPFQGIFFIVCCLERMIGCCSLWLCLLSFEMMYEI